ncbi:MFS transporter [Streptosporangium jomthongense]|uniref:MFS transporter n=1 Tax=Marinobacter aromaticivorans TaxID=1494078 RepID=A0ABW2IUK7_9GAMM|nr:MFS transporter [Marinobacter aromaticivorans]GGE65501.1 MFS transporter [Streptosporangium jomthongense]
MSIFVPFAAGYFASYLYRAINAVIADELVADLGLSANQLGLLTSAYFLAFAVVQLPVGMLLDRFGPRRVEALLLLIAALGAVIFSLADNLAALTLGRLLIGVGVACCLMASFKAFALWFRPDQLPMLNGSLMAFGALGALAATAPVAWLLELTGWRQLFMGLAVMTLIMSGLILVMVPEHRAPPKDIRFDALFGGLKQVLCDRFFWRIAPVAAVFSGSSMAIATLWAAPWLRDIMQQDSGQVATALMFMAMGMGAGFLSLGFILAWLLRHGVRPVPVIAVLMTLFMSMVAAMATGWHIPVLPLFMATMGFLASASATIFSLLSGHFDSSLAGRASTALNLLVFLAAFVFQWGIGIVIGFWGGVDAGAYPAEGYQIAFGTLVVLQAIMIATLVFKDRKLAT